MPTLTIRNVPKTLHDRLKARADEHGRNLSSEVVALLEQSLSDNTRDADALLRRVRALRKAVPALELDPVELKKAARAELL